MNYAKNYGTRTTPQSQAIPGSGQVANSAGGFSWRIDDWMLLDRFLVLGTEGGSYYASEKKMTYQAGEATCRCIDADGVRVVKQVVEISHSGRAPKNDPAIFVLALCAGVGDDLTRKAALEAVPKVCRTGTHLFTFVECVEQFRGWGRGLRTAMSEWYTEKSVDDVAYQMVKYKQRGNWSHRDVLRLCHPVIHDVTHSDMPIMNNLFRWAVGKPVELPLPGVVQASEQMAQAKSAKEVIAILNSCKNCPWEAVPTEFLGDAKVWEVLLPRLPYTAMIRNLGRMTANGALNANNFSDVTNRLVHREGLRGARIHPVSVLSALLTYQQGHGMKGSLSWNPLRPIVDALDAAFYLSFGNVEPTGKRLMLALDVSGSMSMGGIANIPGLTPRVGSAAMALVTASVESHYHIHGFSTKFVPLSISPRQRLDDAVRAISNLPFSGTDCALPMLWALENKVEIDTFVVYTDNETWSGKVHPSQALRRYRDTMGIPAKLVVVGMVSNDFSIADPRDAGMLDVVGFDTATPNVISDFAKQ